jgi:outer membrane protein assembly factor BamE (lipoprotein component of BamABCDE complex)
MNIEILGRFVRAMFIVVLSAHVSGCFSVSYGTMPLTDRLGQLNIGKSERADVLLVLGEPRGEGGAELIQQRGRPREAWYYEYATGSSTIGGSTTIRLKMLVVFFENEKYDGYMWFSSVSKASS